MDGADNGVKERKRSSGVGMKAVYDKIYKTLDYGPIATARGLNAARHVELLWDPCKTLCVGCGNGYEAVYLSSIGFDVTTVDYIDPPVKNKKFKSIVGSGQKLPFADNEFNLVVCCECIEHIPPNEIDGFLNELKRVATFFYFTVDDEDDPPYHTHLCIKTPEWWVEKFTRLRLTGKMFKPPSYREKVGELFCSKVYRKQRGFNIYGNKVLPKPV